MLAQVIPLALVLGVLAPALVALTGWPATWVNGVAITVVVGSYVGMFMSAQTAREIMRYFAVTFATLVAVTVAVHLAGPGM